MSLTPIRIRQRIAAGIKELGDGEWAQSVYPYDVFPSQDGADILDKCYSVGVLSTIVEGEERHRNVQGPRVQAKTIVGIKWTYAIPSDAMLAGYDRALQAELDLAAFVYDTSRDPDLIMRMVDIASRRVVGDGTTFLGEMRWEVLHRYPLD